MTTNTYQGSVIAQRGLHIRSVPSPSGNIPIGGLAYGSWIEADRKQDGWWHLIRINGVPVTGEAWSYEGAANGYIRPEVAVAAPPATGRIFAYVLRNFERPGIGVSRPTMNGSAANSGGLPDTCKLLECKFIPLTRPMQEFWFALLQQSAAYYRKEVKEPSTRRSNTEENSVASQSLARGASRRRGSEKHPTSKARPSRNSWDQPSASEVAERLNILNSNSPGGGGSQAALRGHQVPQGVKRCPLEVREWCRPP